MPIGFIRKPHPFRSPDRLHSDDRRKWIYIDPRPKNPSPIRNGLRELRRDPHNRSDCSGRAFEKCDKKVLHRTISSRTVLGTTSAQRCLRLRPFVASPRSSIGRSPESLPSPLMPTKRYYAPCRTDSEIRSTPSHSQVSSSTLRAG
jgi:hypothetical protein